jgi:hypothetical protein
VHAFSDVFCSKRNEVESMLSLTQSGFNRGIDASARAENATIMPFAAATLQLAQQTLPLSGIAAASGRWNDDPAA